jgi:F-type H+-transporting ATPase subunit gamma
MAGQSARDIKRRIRSVQNIGKVTRAMEAVSASKMRRAQQATLRSRAYATRAYEVAAHLRAQTGAGQGLHPLLDEHTAGEPVVILMTPDRGLTGGLVLNIIRYAVRKVRANQGDTVKWVVAGKKGRDFMVRHGDLLADFTPLPDTPTLLDIAPIARLALDGFTSGEFRSVHVVFANFVSISKQRPVYRQLLPIYVPKDAPLAQSGFTFEPSPEAVLDEMLPRLVELQVYQALLEAQASEHSARMLAMRNATDAAADLVGELTLTYNKARQTAITAEILDIAGGAEALRQTLAAK